MSIDPKVLARAQALKALAESNDNPHEAELASMRLAAYLDKHRLDVAMLTGASEPFGRHSYVLHGSKYLRASLALLTQVTKHYGVVVLVPSTGNSKVPALVGTQTDIEMAVLMFESLMRQRDRACVVADVPLGMSTTTWRNSFCYGYARRIGERLTELRDRQRAEAVGNTKALELYDRDAVVKRWLEEEMGKALNEANRNKPELYRSGIASGVTAADGADLGQTRVGNVGPRAIGA